MRDADLAVLGVWIVRLAAWAVAVLGAATTAGIAWRVFATLSGI